MSEQPPNCPRPAGDGPAQSLRSRAESAYTFEDLAAGLGDLRTDPEVPGSQEDLQECAAALLSRHAGRMRRKDVSRMEVELRRRGAGARWAKVWAADARAAIKEGRQTHSEDPVSATAADQRLADLRGGAFVSAVAGLVAERVGCPVEAGAFVTGPDGLLYKYERGHCPPQTVEGKGRWLSTAVRSLLVGHDAIERFNEGLVRDVAYDISARAPALVAEPPAGRLCLENGYLDVATGRLEPHAPGRWRSTHALPIRYEPGARADAWTQYFSDVLPDDAGAPWGFRLVRGLLAPATGRRRALYLFGPGGGGKSTFLDLLVHAVGGEDGRAVSVISLQELDQDRFATADLFGRTLNVCADLPAQPLRDVSVFKRITGGDPIRAQAKHKAPFTYRPHAHLLFASNHPLRVAPGHDDGAFWDRWLVVPFVNDLSGRREPLERLRACLLAPDALSGLLNAALASGHGGPPEPTPSMHEALAAMRAGGDVWASSPYNFSDAGKQEPPREEGKEKEGVPVLAGEESCRPGGLGRIPSTVSGDGLPGRTPVLNEGQGS